MTADRKTAFVTGALFIVTFVTSIAAMLLYEPTINEPDRLLSGAAESRILLGGFLEMLLIVANVGTAVVLYRVLKRKNQTLSIAYVTARLTESGFIAVGLLAMLTLVTINQNGAGSDQMTTAIGESLVALHDWTFLLGPGWIVGLGNGLVLGYVMFRYSLVPRGLAILGLIGGPALLISGTAILFGLSEAGAAPQVIATVPEFIWEAGLGFYLMFKGFRPMSSTDATGELALAA